MLTRNSSFKTNNSNDLSPSRLTLQRFPRFVQPWPPVPHSIAATQDMALLSGSIIVARVQPRTSKGITDLLLPQTSIRWFIYANSPFKKFTFNSPSVTPGSEFLRSSPPHLLDVATKKAKHALIELIYHVKVSFVIGIDQTIHTTN